MFFDSTVCLYLSNLKLILSLSNLKLILSLCLFYLIVTLESTLSVCLYYDSVYEEIESLFVLSNLFQSIFSKSLIFPLEP